MSKRSKRATFPLIMLEVASAIPLYRQLYQALRQAILTAQIRAGARLPSTRTLATGLGVSRNTIVSAFEQLRAEGYVESKSGSGAYVARVLPDELLSISSNTTPPPLLPGAGRNISQRGTQLATAPRMPLPQIVAGQGPAHAFLLGLPAFDIFPHQVWGRLLARRWRRSSSKLLTYSHPAGYQPLRQAIADYLASTRGVRCEAEQVIIVAGSQQALSLVAQVLLDPGDAVWVEEPGYPGARGAFVAAGARLIPVPVDEEGLDVAAGVVREATARLAFVTPSHQFPLGVTMSLGRRLALLKWASRMSAWVLEDDYDSEYRYTGRPLAALQGLDREGRVIYCGTLSKVLFPGLRLGYLVAPPDLVDALTAARFFADQSSPALEQAVLADFIGEGHFVRHIRRTRLLYAERQAILVEAATRALSGLLELRPAEAGMHLVGWLPENVADEAASQQAAHYGVDVFPLSWYALEPVRRGALMLGYAGVSKENIETGVHNLARALQLLR